MKNYRIRKLEEEVFAGKSFKKPVELVIKHGKEHYSYWGVPEVLAVQEKEVQGHKMSLVAMIQKTKRDIPGMYTLGIPDGKSIESFMTPCKYMDTDRGYRNVIGVVIGALMMLNLADFYMMATMTELGVAAFTSTPFLVAVTAVFTLIIPTIIFNQTHFTYRLSLECYDVEKEHGLCHFCYAVDCDVPVPNQLAWFTNYPEQAKELYAAMAEALRTNMIDLRTQVLRSEEEKQEMLQDRKWEQTVRQDSAVMMNSKASAWDNPVIWILIMISGVLAAALVYLLSGVTPA
jgi:hypothetical protein